MNQEGWAEFLTSIIGAMEANGCQFAAHNDVIYVYKDTDIPTEVELP